MNIIQLKPLVHVWDKNGLLWKALFYITHNIRYRSTIGESSCGSAARSGKVDAIGRRVRLGECKNIIIVSGIHQGVPKHKRSVRRGERDLQWKNNEYERKIIGKSRLQQGHLKNYDFSSLPLLSFLHLLSCVYMEGIVSVLGARSLHGLWEQVDVGRSLQRMGPKSYMKDCVFGQLASFPYRDRTQIIFRWTRATTTSKRRESPAQERGLLWKIWVPRNKPMGLVRQRRWWFGHTKIWSLWKQWYQLYKLFLIQAVRRTRTYRLPSRSN